MEEFLKIFQEDWGNLVIYAPRVFFAVLVVFVSYLIGNVLSKIVIMMLTRTSLEEIHAPFFRVTTILILVFFGIILALNLLGLEKLAVSMLAGGGITAIVLGFAFREIGENFLAGFFLAFSRPFNTGDYIMTEDIQGKVKNIELRYTHLRTDDGRDVYVPSSQLFNKPVTNFTRDKLRRFSIIVGVDYQNDAKKACELLNNSIKDIKGVLKSPESLAYILSLSPQYVEIEVLYWVEISEAAPGPLKVRTEVGDRCRKTLLEAGFTVSSETTSNIAIVRDVYKGSETL